MSPLSLAGASGFVGLCKPEAPARDNATLAGASGFVGLSKPEAQAREGRGEKEILEE